MNVDGSKSISPAVNAGRIIGFLVILAVAALGLLSLPETLGGDQALFMIYAAQINEGALLYRDVWDIKQPGIFVFYLIAGKLFGFTEFGVHFFELLYWLAFSLVLQRTLKDYFRHRLFALLTPLLTVGVYYAVSGSWHLTQVEGLASFPIYLSLWLAVQSLSAETPSKKFNLLFLSGFFGGVVLILKLMFLPIIGLFWLCVLYRILAERKTSFSAALTRSVAPLLLGAVILPVACLAYFASNDLQGIVYYTFFVYPPQAMIELGSEDRLPILKRGLWWFLSNFKTLIILAGTWFVLTLLRSRKSGRVLIKELFSLWREIDLFTAGLVIWLIVGLGVILAQRLSWWEYHYLLLFAPLGILAAKGIDSLWERAKRLKLFSKLTGKAAFAVCVMLLFFPTLYQIARKAKSALVHNLNAEKTERFAAYGDLSDKYQTVRNETAFLNEPGSRPGRIFVSGHPLYYYLSRRPPALASNGWMPQFFLAEQWQRLRSEIDEKKPVYILIEHTFRKITDERSPATIRFLEERYHLRSKGKDIDCYELRSDR